MNFLKAMKLIKNPAFLEGLAEFHNSLALHLAYLVEKPDRDDFDIEFLEQGKKYIAFLQEIGMPIDLPVSAEPAAVEEPKKHAKHDPFNA